MTEQILAEIERADSNQRSIAALYARGIVQCQAANDMRRVDWPRVNAAILLRYKPSGLNRIKKLAWDGEQPDAKTDPARV